MPEGYQRAFDCVLVPGLEALLGLSATITMLVM
jgi:hypothetical protein